MKIPTVKWRKLLKPAISFGAGLFSIGMAHSVAAVELLQTPLSQTVAVPPVVMFSMTVDHELFKKAYNDYSNLDGGILREEDTTYRNDFSYYGYYDSGFCYDYKSSGYFEPASTTGDHQCNGNWSGNFLNWATMTRVDILRQVLFGGKRSVDTPDNTILERAFLPKDVHAFVKVYEADDVNKYTPYSHDAISLCNVSASNDGDPEVRVAKGAWRQWSASEGHQCQVNGLSTTPSSTIKTVIAKVQVCKSGKDGADNASMGDRCKPYSTGYYKPSGVLQENGKDGQIKFGLVTGSYKANLKGGVLRKKASLFANNDNPEDDEFNLSTGQFTGVKGIVSNISAFKIASYSFSSSNYSDCSTHSIPIATVKGGKRDDNRTCSAWGNPLAEIYLETLRYIAGKKEPTGGFDVDDSTALGTAYYGISGLSRESNWDDPILNDDWCAKCFVVALSTGANSFDGDDLSSASDLQGLSGASDVGGYTDEVGTMEFGGFGGSYFAGGTGEERHCDATTLAGLSAVVGICPEQPALEGTYAVAGLAHYARTEDIRGDRKEDQTVKTYAVDLAESLPSFTIPVGSGNITFLPACEAKPGGNGKQWQGCSLTDVQVEEIVTDSGGNPVRGSYLFYWEDSLWGNDYDLDGAQRIAFCVGSVACGDTGVSAGEIRISNSIPYAFAGNSLRFSYTITGTGINDGLVTPWADRPGGSNFDTLKSSPDSVPDNVTNTVNDFNPGSSTATLLHKPLYYAAKYGGFDDKDKSGTLSGGAAEWDEKNNLTGEEGSDGVPDSYFSVSNPARLESSLKAILADITGELGAAAATAANSTQLGTDTYLYQATFNSTDWTGELEAFKIGTVGTGEDQKTVIAEDPAWSAATLISSTSLPDTQYITYRPDLKKGVSFAYSNLSDDQKGILDGADGDGAGDARVAWTKRGSNNKMRDRDGHYLGDIVNSAPVYAGDKDYGFDRYAVDKSYKTFVSGKTEKTLFAGANDGMLHAFNAETGVEKFAYIPSGVYQQLHDLSLPDYGRGDNKHKFSVDGPLFVGDAYWGDEWRTILVGTLGAGGKGLYVLDVTDPTGFNADNVLLEVTPDTAGDKGQYIGHIFGQPTIAPISATNWAIIIGNGYNSTYGEAGLLIISESGIKFVGTGVGGDNGLSEPSLTLGGDGTVNYAYAGDLKGNMWKFDLKAGSVAFDSKPFFKTKGPGDDGKPQPITSAPVLGTNSQKLTAQGGSSTMVYFGTGQYLGTGDLRNKDVQSFYGLADSGSVVSGDVVTNTISENGDTRTVTEAQAQTNDAGDSTFNWKEKNGWRVDFEGGKGERVVSKPQLLFDRLIFPTVIPNEDPCEYGGYSWVMQLTGVGGLYNDHSILAEQGQKNDKLVSLSDFILGEDKRGKGAIVEQSSDGKLVSLEATPPTGAYGRQSWRQLQ